MKLQERKQNWWQALLESTESPNFEAELAEAFSSFVKQVMLQATYDLSLPILASLNLGHGRYRLFPPGTDVEGRLPTGELAPVFSIGSQRMLDDCDTIEEAADPVAHHAHLQDSYKKTLLTAAQESSLPAFYKEAGVSVVKLDIYDGDGTDLIEAAHIDIS